MVGDWRVLAGVGARAVLRPLVGDWRVREDEVGGLKGVVKEVLFGFGVASVVGAAEAAYGRVCCIPPSSLLSPPPCTSPLH